MTVVADVDVLWAHVAMDDAQLLAALVAGLVGGVKTAGRLLTDEERNGRLDRDTLLAGAAHQLGEGLAAEQLHHEEGRPLVLPQLEDLDDVRVMDRGHDPRLVHEHVDVVAVVDQVREHELDRHELVEAPERREPGHVHDRHPARGDLGHDLVAPDPVPRREEGAVLRGLHGAILS